MSTSEFEQRFRALVDDMGNELQVALLNNERQQEQLQTLAENFHSLITAVEQFIQSNQEPS